MGIATHRMLILGPISKQAEQARKQHSASAPASRVHPCVSALISPDDKSQLEDENNPFLTKTVPQTW